MTPARGEAKLPHRFQPGRIGAHATPDRICCCQCGAPVPEAARREFDAALAAHQARAGTTAAPPAPDVAAQPPQR
jgi:hypothetical protein